MISDLKSELISYWHSIMNLNSKSFDFKKWKSDFLNLFSSVLQTEINIPKNNQINKLRISFNDIDRVLLTNSVKKLFFSFFLV
jgi:hypothetical protein